MSSRLFTSYGKKIVAIGRNYAEHAKELKNTVPGEPFFFLKPTTSYVQSGNQIEIPKGVTAHHEVELGVVIGKSGKDIIEKDALEYISGYALAIDMTARNVQDVAKSRGLPWSAAKGFDTFTPIGPFISRSVVPDPHRLRLWLKVNEEIKQDGMTSDMIFRIPRLIAHISSIMSLEDGDLLLTGTPSGVGPVRPGDKVVAGVSLPDSDEVLSTIHFTAMQRDKGYQFRG